MGAADGDEVQHLQLGSKQVAAHVGHPDLAFFACGPCKKMRAVLNVWEEGSEVCGVVPGVGVQGKGYVMWSWGWGSRPACGRGACMQARCKRCRG